MSPAEKLNLVSVEDYLAGELISPIKREYLAGVVYAMAGARNLHNLREVYQGMNAVLPLTEIGIDLPLAEIYEAVEFTPESEEDPLDQLVGSVS
jgi:Uma2 family endonuclease